MNEKKKKDFQCLDWSEINAAPRKQLTSSSGIIELHTLACVLAAMSKTLQFAVEGTKQTEIGIVMDYITHIHTNTVPLTFVYVNCYIKNASRVVQTFKMNAI